MCRYAMTTYKPHYACFACRKAFRRRLRSDIKRPGLAERPARCPQCGLLMADMGLDFKPPKQQDQTAWELAARLWEVGITFHSCGCSGPGYRPREPREYQAFLERTRADYLAVLRHHVEANPSSPKGLAAQKEAIAAWRERIARLEAALSQAR
jgi:DNA-directed RNA polymerase subunit RPC12/RpoP